MEITVMRFLLPREFNYRGREGGDERTRSKTVTRKLDKYQSDRVTCLTGLDYEARQVRIRASCSRRLAWLVNDSIRAMQRTICDSRARPRPATRRIMYCYRWLDSTRPTRRKSAEVARSAAIFAVGIFLIARTVSPRYNRVSPCVIVVCCRPCASDPVPLLRETTCSGDPNLPRYRPGGQSSNGANGYP